MTMKTIFLTSSPFGPLDNSRTVEGFDPMNRKLLMDIIEELHQKGSTMILITHYMEEVERLCDRILLLRDGKAKAYGTVNDVRKEFGGKSLDEIFVEVYGAKEVD